MQQDPETADPSGLVRKEQVCNPVDSSSFETLISGDPGCVRLTVLVRPASERGGSITVKLVASSALDATSPAAWWWTSCV